MDQEERRDRERDSHGFVCQNAAVATPSVASTSSVERLSNVKSPDSRSEMPAREVQHRRQQDVVEGDDRRRGREAGERAGARSCSGNARMIGVEAPPSAASIVSV